MFYMYTHVWASKLQTEGRARNGDCKMVAVVKSGRKGGIKFLASYTITQQ